jgi:hypothetical protein
MHWGKLVNAQRPPPRKGDWGAADGHEAMSPSWQVLQPQIMPTKAFFSDALLSVTQFPDVRRW